MMKIPNLALRKKTHYFKLSFGIDQIGIITSPRF